MAKPCSIYKQDFFHNYSWIIAMATYYSPQLDCFPVHGIEQLTRVCQFCICILSTRFRALSSGTQVFQIHHLLFQIDFTYEPISQLTLCLANQCFCFAFGHNLRTYQPMVRPVLGVRWKSYSTALYPRLRELDNFLVLTYCSLHQVS